MSESREQVIQDLSDLGIELDSKQVRTKSLLTLQSLRDRQRLFNKCIDLAPDMELDLSRKSKEELEEWLVNNGGEIDKPVDVIRRGGGAGRRGAEEEEGGGGGEEESATTASAAADHSRHHIEEQEETEDDHRHRRVSGAGDFRSAATSRPQKQQQQQQKQSSWEAEPDPYHHHKGYGDDGDDDDGGDGRGESGDADVNDNNGYEYETAPPPTQTRPRLSRQPAPAPAPSSRHHQQSIPRASQPIAPPPPSSRSQRMQGRVSSIVPAPIQKDLMAPSEYQYEPAATTLLATNNQILHPPAIRMYEHLLAHFDQPSVELMDQPILKESLRAFETVSQLFRQLQLIQSNQLYPLLMAHALDDEERSWIQKDGGGGGGASTSSSSHPDNPVLVLCRAQRDFCAHLLQLLAMRKNLSNLHLTPEQQNRVQVKQQAWEALAVLQDRKCQYLFNVVRLLSQDRQHPHHALFSQARVALETPQPPPAPAASAAATLPPPAAMNRAPSTFSSSSSAMDVSRQQQQQQVLPLANNSAPIYAQSSRTQPMVNPQQQQQQQMMMQQQHAMMMQQHNNNPYAPMMMQSPYGYYGGPPMQ